MKLIAIDLEPTPYKFDLWNYSCNVPEINLIVLFSQEKNWSFDGGHNYQDLPPAKFKYLKLTGGSLPSSLFSTFQILKSVISNRTSLVYICGYSKISAILTIFCCCITKKKFVVFADAFNIQQPNGQFKNFKRFIRNLIRSFTFKYAKAVLVCGCNGMKTAIIAGCPTSKLVDFPYVVDIDRIKNDQPIIIPNSCIEDINKKKFILFFSGRMIKRKGLETLLLAISLIKVYCDWCLWIEGDGVEFDHYQSYAFKLGVEDNCNFLGFCQYQLHSWLILNSNIVIVPSIEDNWGIVVDEALQLGKVVISTDKTGSAIDRISHGNNGLIFTAGDHISLAKYIEMTINDKDLRIQLQQSALKISKRITPADNFKKLNELINE